MPYKKHAKMDNLVKTHLNANLSKTFKNIQVEKDKNHHFTLKEEFSYIFKEGAFYGKLENNRVD